MKCVVLRPKKDAVFNVQRGQCNIPIVHGHVVDDNIGSNGGFFVDEEDIKRLNGPREIGGRREFDDFGNPNPAPRLYRKRFNEWKSVEDYAAWLAAAHEGWTWFKVEEDDPRKKTPLKMKDLVKPAGTIEPEAEERDTPEPVRKIKSRGASNEYKELQQKAKELMAKGAPAIRLFPPAKKEDLIAYIRKYELALNGGTPSPIPQAETAQLNREFEEEVKGNGGNSAVNSQ